MDTEFVFSFICSERNDLLKHLSNLTFQNDGRWLVSKVNHLDKQVCAIIRISVPNENLGRLQKQLQESVDGLVQFAKSVPVDSNTQTLKLNIDARDRDGIVKDITDVLHSSSAQIVNIDSKRLGVMDMGESVFTADLELKIPLGTEQTIVQDLNDLDEHMVIHTL
jgi:glycine cleavage system regulatory protein